MDFTNYGAEQTLRWGLGQTAQAPPTQLFLALHIGDPGADGTANPAGEWLRGGVGLGHIGGHGGGPGGGLPQTGSAGRTPYFGWALPDCGMLPRAVTDEHGHAPHGERE